MLTDAITRKVFNNKMLFMQAIAAEATVCMFVYVLQIYSICLFKMFENDATTIVQKMDHFETFQMEQAVLWLIFASPTI